MICTSPIELPVVPREVGRSWYRVSWRGRSELPLVLKLWVDYGDGFNEHQSIAFGTLDQLCGAGQRSMSGAKEPVSSRDQGPVTDSCPRAGTTFEARTGGRYADVADGTG